MELPTLGSHVRLTKMIDLKFDGNHPNGINVDSVREGPLQNIKVGERCIVGRLNSYRATSLVIAIIKHDDHWELTTENSIYKLECLTPSLSPKMKAEKSTQ